KRSSSRESWLQTRSSQPRPLRCPSAPRPERPARRSPARRSSRTISTRPGAATVASGDACHPRSRETKGAFAMRGRQVLMDTLAGHGVEYLFGNPGTTESPIIDSLQDYPQIRYIMTLHEGVAVGAASYYAQASGRTGVVNLHVAPGLGNALGMLYNARKAGSPLVVTAGQQDTRLRLRDPLLGHDLAAMAAPLVKWSAQVERADEMAPLLRRAFKVAHDAPSGPVFVALPIDVLEQETAEAAQPPSSLYANTEPDPAGVAALAACLLAARNPVIIAGDDVPRRGAIPELLQLAALLGPPVWIEGRRQHVLVPSRHPHSRAPL